MWVVLRVCSRPWVMSGGCAAAARHARCEARAGGKDGGGIQQRRGDSQRAKVRTSASPSPMPSRRKYERPLLRSARAARSTPPGSFSAGIGGGGAPHLVRERVRMEKRVGMEGEGEGSPAAAPPRAVVVDHAALLLATARRQAAALLAATAALLATLLARLRRRGRGRGRQVLPPLRLFLFPRGRRRLHLRRLVLRRLALLLRLPLVIGKSSSSPRSWERREASCWGGAPASVAAVWALGATGRPGGARSSGRAGRRPSPQSSRASSCLSFSVSRAHSSKSLASSACRIRSCRCASRSSSGTTTTSAR